MVVFLGMSLHFLCVFRVFCLEEVNLMTRHGQKPRTQCLRVSFQGVKLACLLSLRSFITQRGCPGPPASFLLPDFSLGFAHSAVTLPGNGQPGSWPQHIWSPEMKCHMNFIWRSRQRWVGKRQRLLLIFLPSCFYLLFWSCNWSKH